jgi:hypothetical protein
VYSIDGKAGIGIDRFGDVAKADGSKPATRTKHGFEDLRRRGLIGVAVLRVFHFFGPSIVQIRTDSYVHIYLIALI